MIDKTSNRLLLILVVVLTVAGFFFIKQRSPVSKKNGTSFHVQAHETMSSRTIRLDSNAWAYEILMDTSVFIYQPFVPGIPGNQPFVSADEAKKCSELVLQKLRNHQIPSLTRHELDSLNISYH